MGDWYAVLREQDDHDWGTGSEFYGEAVAMVKKLHQDGYQDAYIAVIEDGPDPICINEIRDID